MSASQKVGTFQIIGKAKVGGNVASYFCRVVNDELHVVHCIPGPVNADTFLSEARYAVELHNQAMLVGAKNWQRYGTTVQNGFRERSGMMMPGPGFKRIGIGNWNVGTTVQDRVNEMLAKNTLPKLVAFYPQVWEKVLFEKLSAVPVGVR